MLKRLLALMIICVVAGASACLAVQKTQPPTAEAQMAKAAEEFSRQLGLSKKQSESFKAIMKNVYAEMGKIAASKLSSDQKRMRAEKLQKAAQAKVLALLTPAQRKKLDEMTRPKPTPAVATAPHPENRMTFADAIQAALGDLKLSKDQARKSDAIIKDFRKRHAALKQSSTLAPPARKEKADALKSETVSKLNAILTPAQQKQFKARLRSGLRAGPAASTPARQTKRATPTH